MGLLNLTRAQALCIYKLMEVVMVCKDKDLVFAVFQVVALSLKGLNNDQKLLIVGFIAGLSRDHLLREKNNSRPLTNFQRWIEIVCFMGHLTY